MSIERLPGAQRRLQLADVAIEAFARKGYDATSMEEIAEAAGVTKPVLYQHFPSKRALYLELLDYVGGELLDVVVEATQAASGPRQQVEAGFRAYFRFVDRRPSAFRLLFGTGPPRYGGLRDRVNKVEGTIAHAVASLIEAELEPEHREMLGYAVVGLAESASRHWLAVRHGLDEGASGPGDGNEDLSWLKDPDRLAQRIADLAWAGLRAVHPG